MNKEGISVKKLFQEPELDILVFSVEDMISSSWKPGDDEVPGDLL